MEMKQSMGIPGLLVLGLWALALRDTAAEAGMKLTGSPIKLKVSQGQPIKLNCSLEGVEEPEMLWIKDGAVVQSVDQVYIPLDEEHWIGFLSLKSVERTDSGKYWCQVENKGKKEESQQVWLIVEGVPYFTVEPEDLSVSPNTPFHMACAAVGPPEPVTIVWWMGDFRVGLPDISPSILNVSGINQSTVFSCEAHNVKGLSSSRTATVWIKAKPLPPSNVTITRVTSSNASVMWVPGFDGRSHFILAPFRLLSHPKIRMALQKLSLSLPLPVVYQD